MSAPAGIKTQGAAGIVSVERGALWTSSALVAEKFGKRHDNVIQAVRRLECSDGFRLLNFKESSYLNEQGKEQPMYRISEGGFMLLAMGFTGAPAMIWKERFIEAFQAMRRELVRLEAQINDPEWQAARLEGKAALAMAERIVDKALAEAMAGRMYYRDAYRMSMERVRAFAGLIGPSAPGAGLSLCQMGGHHGA